MKSQKFQSECFKTNCRFTKEAAERLKSTIDPITGLGNMKNTIKGIEYECLITKQKIIGRRDFWNKICSKCKEGIKNKV